MRKTLLLITIFLSACAVKQPVTSEEARLGAEEYYQRALRIYQQGELMQAHQATGQSIRIYPNHAHAHQLMGLINQQLGRNALATENLEQAILLAPGDAGITNNYASLLCARKKYAEAEQSFLAAAGYPENNAPDIAWTNAGLCAQRANHSIKAKSFFSEAIKINPGQTIALYQLAKLELENGNTLVANDYLEQYLRHATHTAKTLLLAAQIENTLGNHSGVEDYLGMLRAGFPNSAEKNKAEQLIPIVKSSTTAFTASASIYDEQWIRNHLPSQYTIHIASSKNDFEMSQIAARFLLQPKAIYSITLDGNHLYNLISGDFPDLGSAQSALLRLKSSNPELKPWIRTFESIQASLAGPVANTTTRQ